MAGRQFRHQDGGPGGESKSVSGAVRAPEGSVGRESGMKSASGAGAPGAGGWARRDSKGGPVGLERSHRIEAPLARGVGWLP